jgi:hypothetical protein
MEETTSETAVIVTTTLQQPEQSQTRPLRHKHAHRSTPAISSMLRTPSASGGRFFTQ